MRPTEFQRRKKIDPHQIVRKDRYVMNAIKSHRRPWPEKPLIAIPDDSPETRGLTRESIE